MVHHWSAIVASKIDVWSDSGEAFSKEISNFGSIKGVPLELFTPEGLNLIASAIGTPLNLDKATE